MKFVPLLGCLLKGDEIVELLECWNAEVVYEFDRMHENLPDAYRITAKDEGVEMLFDETQTLTTIFLHPVEAEGFESCNFSQTDFPVFTTIHEAALFAAHEGIATTQGRATFLNEPRNWIKLTFGNYSVHYEFRNDILNLVTIALAKQERCRTND